VSPTRPSKDKTLFGKYEYWLATREKKVGNFSGVAVRFYQKSYNWI